MLRKRPGQIVLINSEHCELRRFRYWSIVATQHALRALTNALRVEVNRDGIRVLACIRGARPLPGKQSSTPTKDSTTSLSFAAAGRHCGSRTETALTLPRTAEVTEISIRPLMKSY